MPDRWPTTTVYRSRIDVWIAVVLALVIGVSLYTCVELFAVGVGGSWWILAITLGAGIVLPLWLLLGTRYTLQPDQLTVRSGPLQWRIPVADISAITPTRSTMSSPALSLDRLRIDYGPGQWVMVSPRDKQRFIKDVERAIATSR